MEKYQSPKGIAVRPFLIRPDTKYNDDGVYKTGLIISEEHKAELEATCKEVFTDEFGKKKPFASAQLPYKKHTVKEGDEWVETDDWVVTLSSYKAPKFFDAKGNAIKRTDDIEKLGGGSKLRLKGAFKAYNSGGKVGVKIYLNEVQVITYVEFNGGGFQADDEEEDGFVAGGGSSNSGGSKASSKDEVADEDIDF